MSTPKPLTRREKALVAGADHRMSNKWYEFWRDCNKGELEYETERANRAEMRVKEAEKFGKEMNECWQAAELRFGDACREIAALRTALTGALDLSNAHCGQATAIRNLVDKTCEELVSAGLFKIVCPFELPLIVRNLVKAAKASKKS